MILRDHGHFCYSTVNDVARVILFSGLYGLFYLLFIRYTGVGEVNLLMAKVARRLRALSI